MLSGVRVRRTFPWPKVQGSVTELMALRFGGFLNNRLHHVQDWVSRRRLARCPAGEMPRDDLGS